MSLLRFLIPITFTVSAVTLQGPSVLFTLLTTTSDNGNNVAGTSPGFAGLATDSGTPAYHVFFQPDLLDLNLGIQDFGIRSQLLGTCITFGPILHQNISPARS